MSLILHIGMQKTGTSSIQQFLNGNIDQLRREGIFYPKLEDFSQTTFAGVSFHNCIVAALNNGTSPFPAVDKAELESLNSIIKQTDDRVLLSAEDFSRMWNLDAIKEFTKGIDTKVIMYVREQTAWVQSLYNQRNKILFTRLNERFWTEDILSREDLFQFLSNERYQRMMDYNKIYDSWSSVVGEGNVEVRIYDRSVLKDGDSVADFASYLGIKDISEYNKFRRTNEGLANAWIEIFRSMEAEHGLEITKDFATMAIAAQSAGRINMSGDSKMLPKGVVEKMKNSYLESNRELARKAFGRDELFN